MHGSKQALAACEESHGKYHALGRVAFLRVRVARRGRAARGAAR